MDENFLYKRNLYDAHLKPWIGKPLIKVLTGMRRVGKSCLLRQIIGTLAAEGMQARDIILIDKDSLDFDGIRDYRQLADYVRGQAAAGHRRRCLLIDEVQEIDQWEKAINSMFKEGTWDIYLTGSNASLLSSELATLLSGRYVEIPVYPLSLPEFLQFRELPVTAAAEAFPEYLRHGGFPAIHRYSLSGDTASQYIQSLFATIVLKDIASRHEVRNIPLFENICRFVFDQVGSPFSAKKVADFLKSQRLSISVDTVQRYLGFLTATYALYRVPRFDIKGKRHLEISEKFYVGDIGLRNALLGYRATSIQALLENLVFLELKRRGYSVSVGKLGDAEIDFVASKGDAKQYLQVCYLLASEATAEREFGVLRKLDDNYPKMVLSMDPVEMPGRDGIVWRHIVDFLLEDAAVG
jgi:hypothetical protein